MVKEKLILVRQKSVKSQGISFQTKSGHPVSSIARSLKVKMTLCYEPFLTSKGVGA